MTCCQTNYLHWRSQCCYHCFLPQGYLRSQFRGWIISQNIHLLTHFLFSIWQRLVGGAKSHTLIWDFTIFPGDKKLYVCKAVDSYLERNNAWGVGESQFLVSHIKPHKPVSPSTVFRWLGQVLAMVGINTEVFKAHSIRSASSSKTELTGVSLIDIIKQGHWSQTSTFQKFYRKSIKEYDTLFFNQESSTSSFEERRLD